jgi:fatty acid-binding protein DegV
MTPQLAEQLGVASVPLVMRLGREEYVDDETLDLPNFMSKMKACVEKVGSASPSPLHYMEH